MIWVLILLQTIALNKEHQKITISTGSESIFKIYQDSKIYLDEYNDDYLLIVENQSNDTFVRFKNNSTTTYSASWMGKYGSYILYIPKSAKLFSITIKPFESHVNSTTVKFKLITLASYGKSFIKGLKYYTEANNLRLLQFFGYRDQTQNSLILFEKAKSLFIIANKDFFIALSSFEKAIALSQLDKNRASIEQLHDSLRYWKKNKNDNKIIRVYNYLGLAYWREQNLDKAIDYFQLIISEIGSSKNALILEQVFNNLGLIYFDKGAILKSKSYFDKSLQLNDFIIDFNHDSYLTIVKKISSKKNKKNIIATINNLALVYDSIGAPDITEKLWKSYLVLSKDLIDDKTSIVRTNVSLLNYQNGKFDLAIVQLYQAIITFKKTNNKRWLSLAQHNLGQVYFKLGLYQLAEIQFNKAISLRDAINNPKGLVESQLKLLELYRKQGKYLENQKLSVDTLRLAKKIEHHKALALIRLNDFHINVLNKNYNQAEIDINTALQRAKGKTYKRVLSKLNVYKAELLLVQNKGSIAIEILQTETKNLKKIWDTTLLNKANNLLAKAYIKNGQLDKAGHTIKNEIDNLNFYINSSNNGKIRDNLSTMLKETLSIYNTISLKQNKSIQGFIKTNQSLVSFHQYNKGDKKQSNLTDDSINELLNQINSKSLALENSKLSSEDRKQIQGNIIELKSQLDFSYSSYKKVIEGEINIGDIQKKLDDETLIIQYSIGEVGGVSWWITKNKFESFVLSSKNELSTLISLAHNEFTQKSHSFDHITQLSKELIKPLSNYKHIKNIRLVLDEPLNLVPFNALPDPRYEKDSVLAENTLIKRYSSIQPFLINQDIVQTKPEDMSMMIIADPVTAANDRRLKIKVDNETSFPYTRLISTQKEANNISQLFKANVLQGFDANKGIILNRGFDKSTIIHFATHAFFHPEIPGLSSIILSNYQTNGEKSQSAYLRALDIASLEIDAELVVLSGCETGVNQYDNSLGLGGLTQSFMQAGSKNLIASLWKVNDRVTEKMMTEFYRGLHDGLSIEFALAQAQKLIRNKARTRHPKYWAGWFLLTQ